MVSFLATLPGVPCVPSASSSLRGTCAPAGLAQCTSSGELRFERLYRGDEALGLANDEEVGCTMIIACS
jgi:hypothetical protein